MSKKIWNYIISILCIVIGIYLIIKPVKSFETVVYAIGIILLVEGIIKCIFYLIKKEKISSIALAEGIINIVFGLILVGNPNLTVKVVSIFIGIWFIIKSSADLYEVLSLKKNTISHRDLVVCIIKLILGLIILTTPIIATIFTGYLLGVLIVLIGVVNIINNIKDKKDYSVKVK